MLTLKKNFQVFTYQKAFYYLCSYFCSTCKVHCTLRKLYYAICDVFRFNSIYNERDVSIERECLYSQVYFLLSKPFSFTLFKVKESKVTSQMQLSVLLEWEA